MGGAGPAARLAGETLAAARRRDLGKPRRPAPLHVLGPDDVGGVRARDTDRPPARAARPYRPLVEHSKFLVSGRAAGGLEPRPPSLRPIPRRHRPGRVA